MPHCFAKVAKFGSPGDHRELPPQDETLRDPEESKGSGRSTGAHKGGRDAWGMGRVSREACSNEARGAPAVTFTWWCIRQAEVGGVGPLGLQRKSDAASATSPARTSMRLKRVYG